MCRAIVFTRVLITGFLTGTTFAPVISHRIALGDQESLIIMLMELERLTLYRLTLYRSTLQQAFLQ